MAWTVSDLISRVLVVFQLVVQQVQYISLFNQLDIQWPDGFRAGYKDMEVININLRQYVADVELPIINYRGLFTIISIMIPIVITLCVLLLFQPFLVVILYTVLTFGSVVLIAGLLGKYISTISLDVDPSTSTSYIIAGAIMTGAAFLFMLVYKVFLHRRIGAGGGKEGAKAELEQKEIHYSSFHRTRTFRHMTSTVFLILLGLTLTGLLNFGIDEVLSSGDINIWQYIGYVFLVLGAINAIYFLACLTSTGRAAQRALMHFLNRNGLMLLLVSLASMYIPVLSYALQMMMCKRYTCPSGTAFNPYGYRREGSWSTSEDLFCDQCTFLNTGTCPAASTTYNGVDLCPGFDSRRAWSYPDTSCDDQASGMFRFAAVVSIVAYGISIPCIFYLVIRFLTKHIDKVTFPGENDVHDADSSWNYKITLVKPVASSLYEAFTKRSRQFVLVTIIQRVLIMVVLVVIAPFTLYATAMVFGIYLVFCILLGVLRPYLHGAEKGLSIGLGLANVVNGIIALVVWRQDVQAFSGLFSIFIAVNVAIPVIGMALGHRMTAALPSAADLKLPRAVVNDNEATQKVLDLKTGQVHLSRFFMFTGVFFVIAFGACVVGMLQTPDSEWLISTSSLYQTNAQVLADYSNWQTMTDNCCCIQSENPPEAFSVSERWLCTNGKVIERGRTKRDGSTSIPLRSICGTAPTDTRCTISTDSKGVPYMNCPTDVKSEYVPSQVSELAYLYFF